MRYIVLLLSIVTMPLVAIGQGGLSSIVFTNLNLKYFDVDFTRFNTNIVQIKFNTNQFDVSGDTITILGLLSNVVINPTDARVPVRASATNFVDSPIRVTATNEVAADIFNTYYLRVTNLIAGGVVVSIPDGDAGILTNAPPGAGFLYSPTGTNDFNWLAISDVCLWTNVAGEYLAALNPTAVRVTNLISSQVLTADGALIVGQAGIGATPGVNNVATANKSYITISSETTTPSDTQIRLAVGNSYGAFLILQNDQTNAFQMLNGDELWDDSSMHLYLSGGDWEPTSKGESMLLFGTGYGWAEVGRFGGSTNVLTDSLWEYAGGYLKPQDLTQPLFWTNAVSLSVGHTNSLYMDGVRLTYSALNPPAGYPYLVVTNVTESNGGWYGAGGNLAVIRGASGVSLNDAYSSGNELRWAFNGFGPPSDTHVIFGGDETTTSSFVPLYRVNQYTNNVFGFLGSSVNYSKLEIKHLGTNSSTGGPFLNSVGAGTAGVGRLIHFGMDGTNYWTMDNRSGTAYLNVTSDGSNISQYGAAGNIAKVIGPVAIYLQGNNGIASYVVANGSGLVPSPTGSLTLGTTANAWDQLALTNTAGSTNFIYFGTNRLSVTGTDLYWNSTKLN